MGCECSSLTTEDLDDYQALTFLTRQEIQAVLKRFTQLTSINQPQQDFFKRRLSRRQAVNISELHQNPFRERIVEVFSSQPDGSITFEDFLDMISVFSENAPKSVKVSYAFKIYQGICKAKRPDDAIVSSDAIDLYDLKEIIRRLSGKKFSDEDLTIIAEAVINEVDLRDDKLISAEIFEYFLSNVPDFPSSFVIPLSDGKEDRYLTTTVSVQPEPTVTTVKRVKKRRAAEKDKTEL